MTDTNDREAERSMEQADEANGEGPADAGEERHGRDRDDGINDTEERYGEDESPA